MDKNNKQIKIPFNWWSKVRLKDHKRATSRSKVYGCCGDWFIVDDVKYKILEWAKLPTEFIINNLYQIEGAISPEELRKIIKGIFRGNKLPKHLYTHFFEEVKNGK